MHASFDQHSCAWKETNVRRWSRCVSQRTVRAEGFSLSDYVVITLKTNPCGKKWHLTGCVGAHASSEMICACFCFQCFFPVFPSFCEFTTLGSGSQVVRLLEMHHPDPGPWEDLKSRTPNLVPYTTIG